MTAAERGVRFLADRQLPSGGFELRVGLDLPLGQTEPDRETIFGTALVAHALCGRDDAASREIVRRATRRLQAHALPGGVWQHWDPAAPQHPILPPDADDTACASMALRDAGEPVPDNRRLLLANRDGRGLFFTWLVVHGPPAAPLTRDPRLWRLAARRWRHPLLASAIWRMTSASPRDVDAVVNANVLAHLGDGPHAAAVADFLVEAFERGDEERSDRWYRSRFAFYRSTARAAAAGVRSLDRLREPMAARIAEASGPDGRIGDTAQDTALAVCALADLGAGAAERERACAWLAGAQHEDGSWPADAFYFGGPLMDPRWGSRELTTAFCVEALSAGSSR